MWADPSPKGKFLILGDTYFSNLFIMTPMSDEHVILAENQQHTLRHLYKSDLDTTTTITCCGTEWFHIHLSICKVLS